MRNEQIVTNRICVEGPPTERDFMHVQHLATRYGSNEKVWECGADAHKKVIEAFGKFVYQHESLNLPAIRTMFGLIVLVYNSQFPVNHIFVKDVSRLVMNEKAYAVIDLEA